MSGIAPISNHFHQAVCRLAMPFWGKPRIASLLLAFINRVQGLEDMAWEVINARDVRTATGVHLATLGKVVGQPNFGWDEETYRAVIRGKIRANLSRGRADDIIEVIQLSGGVTAPIDVWHFVPATVLVLPKQEVTEHAITALAVLLPRTRSAGVQMHVAFAPDSATSSYSYSASGLVLGDAVDPITTPGAPWFDVRTL